jgi:hypothetical protein
MFSFFPYRELSKQTFTQQGCSTTSKLHHHRPKPSEKGQAEESFISSLLYQLATFSLSRLMPRAITFPWRLYSIRRLHGALPQITKPELKMATT